MVADAGAKVEQWRKALEEAQQERRAVAKPATSEAALDKAVELIAAGVAAIREKARKARPDELRGVLRSFVEKVIVDFEQRPYGKRTRGYPTGGTLYLKDSLVVCKPVSIAHPMAQIT
jgi:hypothetical protein